MKPRKPSLPPKRDWEMKKGFPVVKPESPPTTSDMNLEGMKRTDWERIVFSEATEFTVIRKTGRGQRDRREFKDYADALRDAVPDFQRHKKNFMVPCPMVNAITPKGRHFCIPPNEWKIYLDIWNVRDNATDSNQVTSATAAD